MTPPGEGAGAVSFPVNCSGKLQHTGRESREHRRRSGSHASGFAFPERGPALPGAGPWLPVPAARSMMGQALPWRRSARPARPRAPPGWNAA